MNGTLEEWKQRAKDAEERAEGMRNVLMLTEIGVEVSSLIDERDVAQDERRAIEAERDRYRAALEKIRDDDTLRVWEKEDIAREALQGEGNG